MEKAKILAVAKEVNTREVGQTGRKISELEVVIGYPSEKFDGYVPSARAVISKKDGRAYAFVPIAIPMDTLGSYRPEVGDDVVVTYNRYGEIASLCKADA